MAATRLRIPLFILAVFLLALIAAPSAFAATPSGAPYDPVGKRLNDKTFIDQDGKSFRLSELQGRPLVISYVYAACPHVCPTTLASLKRAFDASGGLGRDYTALTVDFDPENASPAALKEFGARFTDDFAKWRFATADKLAVAEMANETGLYYERDRNGRDFTHSNQVTVLAPDGTIAANLRGAEVDARRLAGALKAAAAGRTVGDGGGPMTVRPGAAGVIDRLVLLCYTYDEASGDYKVNWGVIGALTGVLALHVATLWWIARMVFSKRRSR